MNRLPRSRSKSCRISPLLLAAALIVGCQSGPYPASLMLQGGDNLNPTFDSKPSSVRIRILQLEKKDLFESATDEELLASDLKDKDWVVSYQDAKVRVGMEREVEVIIQPKTRYVGIVGLFNETDGKWREVFDLDALDGQKLVFDRYEFSAKPRNP